MGVKLRQALNLHTSEKDHRQEFGNINKQLNNKACTHLRLHILYSKSKELSLFISFLTLMGTHMKYIFDVTEPFRSNRKYTE